MAERTQDIIIRGINRGMADDGIIADTLMPADQVRFIRNLDTDTIGYLKSRKGYTKLTAGAVVSANSLLGLHQHVGTNDRLIAFINEGTDTTAESYYLNAGSWTQKALAFDPNVRIRCISFLDLVYAVNGADNPKSWDGGAGTNWGNTNLVSAPIGSLIEVFRQQVFIANTTTDTVYFSSLPSSGAITWTPATDNFIVNPNDGSNLTAMKRVGQELLFFKRKYFYRFNGRSLDADPIFEYGTASQESLAVVQNALCFYDPIHKTVYAYTGGYPQDIGRAVGKFFAAIPTSNEPNVVCRTLGDVLEFFIGNVTVDGRTYTNCALRYLVNSKAWVVRTYAHSFTTSLIYDDGTTVSSIQGRTDGFIVTMDTGNTDDGTDIGWEMETQWYTGNGNPNQRKQIGKLVGFVDSETPVSMQFKSDEQPSWKNAGSTKGYRTSLEGVNIPYRRVKIRMTGSSNGEPTIIDGFGFVDHMILDSN